MLRKRGEVGPRVKNMAEGKQHTNTIKQMQVESLSQADLFHLLITADLFRLLIATDLLRLLITVGSVTLGGRTRRVIHDATASGR